MGNLLLLFFAKSIPDKKGRSGEIDAILEKANYYEIQEVI